MTYSKAINKATKGPYLIGYYMTIHYNFSYTDNMILNEPLVESLYIQTCLPHSLVLLSCRKYLGLANKYVTKWPTATALFVEARNRTHSDGFND